MQYDITFHPSWWHKNVGICFSQEFFDDPGYRMECDIKMRKALYERFGAYGIGEKDPKKRPLLGTNLLAAGYLYSELMGCEILYKEDNSPQVICRELDEEEIEEIPCVDLSKSEVWNRTKQQIIDLQEEFGHVETYVNLMGIQNIAMDLMGQNVLMAYYSAPDEVQELFRKITDLTIAVGKEFRKCSVYNSAGVTAIVQKTQPECYLTSNCSVEMISNELYEEFLLEYDQRLADTFGHFGVHHCGGTMEHVVDGYAKIRGLTFAEVGAGSDLKTVREKLPHIWLNARFSPVELGKATESEICSKVEALAKDGCVEEGKLSVSCVGIDADVTDTQIEYFLKACSRIEK